MSEYLRPTTRVGKQMWDFPLQKSSLNKWNYFMIKEKMP